MKRSNAYEAALEGYLQWHRHGYVAVDETRRSFLGERRIKSLDFIVYSPNGGRWLVDVKGRRYPGGKPERPRFVWESWSTREDIASLQEWAACFGPGYQPLLVFAYQLQPHAPPLPEDEDTWTWHDQRYVFRAVAVEEYQAWMRPRSERWGTVALARADFLRLSRPLHKLLQDPLRVVPSSLADVPF